MALLHSTIPEGVIHISLCEICPWSYAVYKNNGDPFSVGEIKEKTPVYLKHHSLQFSAN